MTQRWIFLGVLGSLLVFETARAQEVSVQKLDTERLQERAAPEKAELENILEKHTTYPRLIASGEFAHHLEAMPDEKLPDYAALLIGRYRPSLQDIDRARKGHLTDRAWRLNRMIKAQLKASVQSR